MHKNSRRITQTHYIGVKVLIRSIINIIVITINFIFQNIYTRNIQTSNTLRQYYLDHIIGCAHNNIIIMLIALFFLITIVFFYIRFAVKKHRMMKYVGHLPGPKEYPIIGSGLKFLGKNTEGYATPTKHR